MASTLGKNLQVYNAIQFKESVSEPAFSNLYFTIGKCDPWANDAQPDVSNTSIDAFNNVWKNMIGGKRITGNDIKYVIPRYNWTANTVYNMYDDKIDNFANGNFYVLTNEFKVYKCISNNGGSLSSVKPTSTSTSSVFETLDNYIWKYMYSLNAEEQTRFTSTSFMPVKTLSINDASTQWLVQTSAVPGAINSIIVTNPGSGYSANTINVSIRGDGSYANAFARVNTQTNTITQIVVDNPGLNYTRAELIISSPTGAGAAGRAIISPPGGHGSDPLTELGGNYVMIDMFLRNSEGNILPTVNDYRQLAIIQDPLVYQSNTYCANAVVNQLTSVVLSGVSIDYLQDEYVFQGSAVFNAIYKGKVVVWDSANNVLKLSNVEGNPINEILIGSQSTAYRFLNSVVPPDLQPFSGKLLYIDNITPVERSPDQTETFKIVLKF
jgi:hypothetical protein